MIKISHRVCFQRCELGKRGLLWDKRFMFWFVWGCFGFAIQIELSCSSFLAAMLSQFNSLCVEVGVGGGWCPMCLVFLFLLENTANVIALWGLYILLFLWLHWHLMKYISHILLAKHATAFNCNNCISPLRDASHYATILLYRFHFF